ncbi:MAG: hypothetical protein ACLQQ4_04880 [Bacteroidia bacterium]
MSVLVIKIKEEGDVTPLKKLIRSIFGNKATILTDEEYRDSKLAELMEEGLKSETLSAEETRKEFKKRGINY